MCSSDLVATGRGDFLNQVNNSVAFPGIFRGILDAQAKSITDDVALAAAAELAAIAEERGLSDEAIIPSMSDPDVAPRVAAATAMKAQELGLARVRKTREAYLKAAASRIANSREMLRSLVDSGAIRNAPEAVAAR